MISRFVVSFYHSGMIRIPKPARCKELAIAERGWVSIYGLKFDFSLSIGDGNVHPNLYKLGYFNNSDHCFHHLFPL